MKLLLQCFILVFLATSYTGSLAAAQCHEGSCSSPPKNLKQSLAEFALMDLAQLVEFLTEQEGGLGELEPGQREPLSCRYYECDYLVILEDGSEDTVTFECQGVQSPGCSCPPYVGPGYVQNSPVCLDGLGESQR